MTTSFSPKAAIMFLNGGKFELLYFAGVTKFGCLLQKEESRACLFHSLYSWLGFCGSQDGAANLSAPPNPCPSCHPEKVWHSRCSNSREITGNLKKKTPLMQFLNCMSAFLCHFSGSSQGSLCFLIPPFFLFPKQKVSMLTEQQGCEHANMPRFPGALGLFYHLHR